MTPGWLRCTAIVELRRDPIVVEGSIRGFNPVTGPCNTEFGDDAAADVAPPCAHGCGNRSIATCTTCHKNVCGYCSQMSAGKRTCSEHVQTWIAESRASRHAQLQSHRVELIEAIEAAKRFRELPPFERSYNAGAMSISREAREIQQHWARALGRILSSTRTPIAELADLVVTFDKVGFRREAYVLHGWTPIGVPLWNVPLRFTKSKDTHCVDGSGVVHLLTPTHAASSVCSHPLAAGGGRSMSKRMAVAWRLKPEIVIGSYPMITNVAGYVKLPDFDIDMIDIDQLRAMDDGQ